MLKKRKEQENMSPRNKRILYIVVSYKCLKNMKTRTIEGTAWNSKEAIRIMNRTIDNSQLFDIAKKPYFEKYYACSSMNRHVRVFEEIWTQKIPLPITKRKSQKQATKITRI